MTPRGCPDETMLARLVSGELERPDHDTVAAHLGECGACARTVERLSTVWSRDHLPLPSGQLSDRTRAVQERLAASPPPLVASGTLSAAIPRAIPEIPGIGHLEARFHGGMGVVYRAEDLVLRRPVAVKVLWPTAAGSATAWARAKREALMLARISHANVVAVYAAGETGGSPYLVMEWVDGPSLQRRLEEGLPTPLQAARIVRDLARAVECVHALGIVHRDIKPDNVLLAGADAHDWDRCLPKLADFGLARPADVSQQLTHDAAALGTPASMAPEQTGLAPELGETGPATDIHGLGGLAFALLTGTPPFEAATAAASLQRAVRGEVAWPAGCGRIPRDLRAIVETCLEREPRCRYASAAELADDLHRFCDGLPVRARPVSPLRRLGRAIRRRPTAAAAIGLSIAFAIAALGGLATYEARIAGARDRVDRSERRAQQTAGVAARSMGRTGALLERMIRQGSPDDPANLELLRQVRDEFFDWPLQDDPVESLRVRVQGLGRVVNVLIEAKHHDDALACNAMALEVLDELAARQPTDPQTLVEQLHCLHVQRVCLHHLRRMDEAIASARMSLALLERFPADLPDREKELVRATLDLGMFLSETGQHDEGSRRIDEALAGIQVLRAARPDEVSLVEQEAHALFSAILSAANAGRTDDCRRWSERLVDEIGGFLDSPQAESLTVAQRGYLTRMTCIGVSQRARLAHETGDTIEAVDLLDRQRQLCEGFVATLPAAAVDPLHGELVEANLLLASLLAEVGRTDEARAAVARAGRITAHLLDRQPAVPNHAALQVRVVEREAELTAARGEPPSRP